jgi:NAD(P)-dependent dehydrogenase (short-subunit alcohol dehydrogenase family)
MKLTNTTVLITGASSGIGAASAQAFAEGVAIDILLNNAGLAQGLSTVPFSSAPPGLPMPTSER